MASFAERRALLSALVAATVVVTGACGDSPSASPDVGPSDGGLPQDATSDGGARDSGSPGSDAAADAEADASGRDSGPGCGADGVFFRDGFESGDLSTAAGGFTWGESVSAAVNDVSAGSGSHSLELVYSAGADGEDSFAEQRFSLGSNYDDIWIRYSLYVPDNYRHRSQASIGESDNNKGFLYLWSDDYGSPSGPGMGPNLWPNDDESSASFYYWGPGLDRHLGVIPEAIVAEDRGQWVTVTMHYRYASEGAADGVAEIWKERGGVVEKICDVQDGDWYVAGQPGFDRGYIFGWANSGFDDETSLRVDDFVASTSPLMGCAP